MCRVGVACSTMRSGVVLVCFVAEYAGVMSVFMLGLEECVVVCLSCCADHRRGRCRCPELLFESLTVCLVTTCEISEGWLAKDGKGGKSGEGLA